MTEFALVISCGPWLLQKWPEAVKLYYKVLPTKLENIGDILMSLQNWRTNRPRGCVLLSPRQGHFSNQHVKETLWKLCYHSSCQIKFPHFVKYSFYKCICNFLLSWCMYRNLVHLPSDWGWILPVQYGFSIKYIRPHGSLEFIVATLNN